MKRHSKLFASFLTLLLLIGASTASVGAFEILAEAKAGYFYPSNHRFQKIYHDGGGIYGGEISVGLCDCDNDWYAWVSGDYFERHGRSIGGHDKTTIKMVPVGFGFKYFFPACYCDMFRFYVGAGGLATWLRLRDHSHYVVPKSEKWGFGGIIKSGVIVDFCDGFFADIFVDYSILDIKFHDTKHRQVTRQKAHLDGLSAGLGLGYRF